MPFFLNKSFPGFKDRPLLFIDLEMSGLDVNRHEILEAAALLVDPRTFGISNSFYTKVLPTHIETADPAALKVIEYSPKNWSDAIPLHQALIELSQFSPYCILAGWSVQNEWDFLIHALNQEKLPFFFDNYLIEVWTIAYIKFYQDTGLPRLNLQAVCNKLGIHLDQHKPDSDIKATYEIFKKIISDFHQKPRP
jgi:oligoribonuclease (3'-5' exoribonuclease)